MTITRLKRSQSLQSFNFQTNLMKKIILLALVGTGIHSNYALYSTGTRFRKNWSEP
jgi:multisubunit Na+/H+ antiporter MnhC subunit